MKVLCKLNALCAFASSRTAEDENDMNSSTQERRSIRSRVFNKLYPITAEIIN